jgi:spore germination cell wall hydrolase CwlJ-like protein
MSVNTDIIDLGTVITVLVSTIVKSSLIFLALDLTSKIQKLMKNTIGKLLLVVTLFASAVAPAETHHQEPPTVSESVLNEIRCLELNLHFEARGEPLEGQKAVANVTINRAKSGKFPNTICEVVKQPFQFSWFNPKKNYEKVVVHPTLREIAYRSVLSINWKDNVRGAMYFHNKSVDNFNRKMVATIGEHHFYK